MPPWRRNLLVVAAANFVTMIGMSAFLPFLPQILREGGLEDPVLLKVWSGLVVGAAPLAAAFTGPLWGALADRVGAKVMVLRSLVAITVTVGLMGALTCPEVRSGLGLSGWWLTPWPLFWLRFVQGVFSGYIAPSLTLVTVSAPAERQGFVTSVSQSSLIGGTVVGPVVGAWTAGWGGAWLSFAVCSGMALLAAALVALLVLDPDARRGGGLLPSAEAVRRAWTDVRGNLSRGGFKAVLLGLFLSQLALNLANPVLLLHVEGLEGVAPGEGLGPTAWAFSAVALGQLLFAPLWGAWVDRAGTRGVVPVTMVLTALAVLPQALIAGLRPFCALRFLQGALAAGTVPTAYVHIGRLSAVRSRGGMYALTLSSFQLANVAAPALGGVLAAAFGTRPLFLISAALLAVSSLWTRRRM